MRQRPVQGGFDPQIDIAYPEKPLVKTVWGEVVTEEPLLQRFGPLSVIQLLYLLLNVVLFVVANLDTAFEKWKFNWHLFGKIWLGVSTGLMLLMWLTFKLWSDACKTLPFKGQKRQRGKGYVTGMPMHSAIQRSMILATGLFQGTLFLFTYILNVTEEFKGHLDHSISVRLLGTLAFISWGNILIMAYSIITLGYPTAAVQNVMVFVPTDK